METKIYGYIYMITNLINGKIYIGQTIRKINIRFNQHINDSKKDKPKCYIHRAIKKYGKENFKIETIHIVYNQEEISSLEGFYIKKYKSNIRKYGYNLKKIDAKGNHRHSNETKNKLRKQSLTKKRIQISSNNGKLSRGKRKYKYTGITFHKNNTWSAQIRINNKKYHIGTYSTEIEAAQARDIEELKYSGENAILNFPELKNKYLNNEIQINKRKRGDFSPSFKKSDTNLVNLYYDNSKKRWIYRNRKNKIRKSFKTKEEAENFILSLS